MANSDTDHGRSTLVVVCNSGDNSLGLFDLDRASGSLNPVSTVPLPDVGVPDGAYPMTVSPDRRLLYIAFRGKPHEVLTFAVDAQARELHWLGRGPLADSMAHIATDQTGQMLFSASYGGGTVSMNPITADGVVQGPAAVLKVAPNMHCCLVSPENDTLFATSLGDHSIVRFGFDAINLTELPGRIRVSSGSGPRHLVWHPSQRFAYLINEKTTAIDLFAYHAEARTLEPLETVSGLPEGWTGEAWAADIRITPDGRFLFASDRNSNAITAFAVDSETGRLTRRSHVITAPWPRSFNVTTDGRYLLALGEVSNIIECFSIDETSGALQKRSELPTGKGPSWVETFA